MLKVIRIPIAVLLLLCVQMGYSQTFLNGSFEVTTATMTCNYNLNNGTFNSLMSDNVAFGAANETDILINGCYTSGIPDGVRAIGIAGNRDEVSLPLSTPLTPGEEYTISFYTRSEITFRVRGDVEVGASTSATAFGTTIFTATTVEETWVYHEFSFVALEASTHITVRNVAGPIHWNHVDNFVMLEDEDDLEIVPTHPTCFGGCDGIAEVTGGIFGPYTYLWSPEAGGGTDATATDLCAGTYTVEVTNASGGVEELEVTIVDPEEIVGGITDQTAVTCFGGSDGTALAEATGGTGALTYDIGGGPVDVGEFVDLAAGAYTITVTDENDCILEIPLDIAEPDELILSEVATTNILCAGDATGSIEIGATGGTGAYEYSIDDIVFDPSPLFTDLTVGDYSFTVRDENGCEATLDVSLTEPEPIVADNISTGEICEGDCAGTIWLDPSGGVGPFSYSIDDCLTTEPDGAFSDLCAGDYNICIEDANGCRYTEVLTVDAGTPPVDATLFAIDPLCETDGPVAILGVDLGDLTGTGVVGTTFDPAIAGPGTHTITNTITDGCGGMATVDVVVNPSPTVTFMTTDPDGCVPIEIDFSSIGDAGVTCLWEFGDGSFSSDCGVASHTYDTPGNYDVTLTLTDVNGCSASTTYPSYISAYVLPEADFDFAPRSITTLDTEVDFTDLSSGAEGWTWTFDAYGNSSEQNPTFLFPTQAGNYEVTLEVTTANGCTDEITQVVTINDEQLMFVPNTITPDGDPFNQEFLPYFTGIDIYDYHLVLYNRWGEVIFESYDLSVGWDGTYGGEIVPNGVYIWHIRTADIATDKKLEYHGHVTVLR